MRKNYVDNLRWFCILLLFPYHTAMMYNDWGENFYIRGPKVKLFSAFIIVTWPWFMPLLFVLAGISTSYALQKRTTGEYINERYNKLLVPLFYGILLLVPVQTYFAERFHNGYTGNYFQQYILFFTKYTDLTGYTGGFTVGHLWFILYLFVISLLALPIINLLQKYKGNLPNIHFTFLKLLPMFIIPFMMSAVLNIGGKSLGEYFALFLLGYFIFSRDQVIESLVKRRWPLFAAAIVFLIGKLVIYYGLSCESGILVDLNDSFYMWICILMLLGMGKQYFNYRNRVTAYLAKASFPIYVLHQSCIVVAGYYIFSITTQPSVQFILIIIISACATFLLYELLKRVRIFRFMFAIRK